VTFGYIATLLFDHDIYLSLHDWNSKFQHQPIEILSINHVPHSVQSSILANHAIYGMKYNILKFCRLVLCRIMYSLQL